MSEEELTQEEQKALNELAIAIAQDLGSRKSKDAIVKELTQNGWEEGPASSFVDDVERSIKEYQSSPEGLQAIASEHSKRMGIGLLWLIGGIAVTAVTYDAASSGGTYMVAWGAMLFGAIDFLRGFAGWIRHNH